MPKTTYKNKKSSQCRKINKQNKYNNSYQLGGAMSISSASSDGDISTMFNNVLGIIENIGATIVDAIDLVDKTINLSSDMGTAYSSERPAPDNIPQILK
jgi:hypothetical protein